MRRRATALMLLLTALAAAGCGSASAAQLPAWRKLTGQRIGSRVLLVIPPRLGYGNTGALPVIKPTDTLIYVVDIIAAVPR